MEALVNNIHLKSLWRTVNPKNTLQSISMPDDISVHYTGGHLKKKKVSQIKFSKLIPLLFEHLLKTLPPSEANTNAQPLVSGAPLLWKWQPLILSLQLNRF